MGPARTPKRRAFQLTSPAPVRLPAARAGPAHGARRRRRTSAARRARAVASSRCSHSCWQVRELDRLPCCCGKRRPDEPRQTCRVWMRGRDRRVAARGFTRARGPNAVCCCTVSLAQTWCVKHCIALFREASCLALRGALPRSAFASRCDPRHEHPLNRALRAIASQRGAHRRRCGVARSPSLAVV